MIPREFESGTAAAKIVVTDNDTDADGSVVPSTVEITGNPSNGTAVNNGDGSISYTPNRGFVGRDTVKYTVKDNDGLVSNEALVIFKVKTPSNFVLVSPDNAVLTIGDPLDITWTGNTGAASVDILFTHDNGVHWKKLASGVANNGLFPTFVPGTPTTQGFFRVENPANRTENAQNDNADTILENAAWVKNITAEAEFFDLVPPMQVRYDGEAFYSRFVASPEGEKGTATYSFNASAGVYVLWARTLAQTGLCNSFYISVDGGQEFVWDTVKDDVWRWQQVFQRDDDNQLVPFLFTLTDGPHTVCFRCREPHTRLDCIYLTTQLKATPKTAPKSTIRLLSPQDMENLDAGSVYEITWNSKGIGDFVTIKWSADGPTLKSPSGIALLTENDGSYLWQVPGENIEESYISMSDGGEGGLPMDEDYWPFSIGGGGGDDDDDDEEDQNFALCFDGIDDFVAVPDADALSLCECFTIAFWVKADVLDLGWTRILEKGSYDEYLVGLYGNTGRVYSALRQSNEFGPAKMAVAAGPSNTVLMPDVWTHVAVTNDGKKVRLFMDGVQESVKEFRAKARRENLDLIIGAARSGNGKVEYNFSGCLDNLELWNHARSGEEINAGMFAGPEGTEDGLVAFYNFDTGAGDLLYDRTGNGHDGFLGGETGEEKSKPGWMVSDKPESAAEAVSALCTLQTQEKIETVIYPETMDLLPNYPNPFNAATTISFTIPVLESGQQHVILNIFDIQGRLIRSLVNGSYPAGLHRVVWNGRSDDGSAVSSGLYFCRFRSGEFTKSSRMLYLK